MLLQVSVRLCLLATLLSRVALADPSCGHHNDSNNNRRDTGDHTHSSSSSCTPTATTSRHSSRSASASPTPTMASGDVSKKVFIGVVVGVAVGAVLFTLLTMCCCMRWWRLRKLARRRRSADEANAGTLDSAAQVSADKTQTSSIHQDSADSEREQLLPDTVLSLHPSLRPASLHHSSTRSLSIPPSYAYLPESYAPAMITEREAAPRTMPTIASTTSTRNLGVARAGSITSLPNPHSPHPSFTERANTQGEEPELPPLPPSPQLLTSSSHIRRSQSLSYAPQTTDNPDLSRSPTARTFGSTRSIQSSLRAQISAYRAPLEVHQEGEMTGTADRAGSGSTGTHTSSLYSEADRPEEAGPS